MELLAATLGARFAQSICSRHSLDIERRIFWSDSKTVLCWLQNDPKGFRQFVAFRVGEILELTKVNEWRWIPTKLNVADEATKWSCSPDLNCSSRWFTGPDLLRQNENMWPGKPSLPSIRKETNELRPHMIHIQIVSPCTVNYEYFGTWRRLYNAQACLMRVAANITAIARKTPPNRGPRTVAEITLAKSEIYRKVQHDAFRHEIHDLTSGETHVCPRSPLHRLSPFIDGQGILRIRGRIDAATNITEEIKRPIILPRNHRVTALIVAAAHEKYHHIHNETALNELRQLYFIPKDRKLMLYIRSRCQNCRLSKAKPQCPEMAPLPSTRLASFTAPFSHVGVDFFGPVTIAIGRKTAKRWGMIFTCLTIRAIHLEVAHSLSKESCILCIRNFTARRGQPLTITSDNGTNFHGADNELQCALREVEIEHAPKNIKWKFNPPAAPHMGWSCERLVGIVKRVLNQIMPTTRLPTEELFHTVLLEAESIINARPLTFVAIQLDDAETLTPNHFLIGSSNGHKPPGKFEEADMVSRNMWRKSQYLANLFWERWIKEYLPTITRRTKWFGSVKNVAVGDVVIIVDGNLPRNTWPKGIVQSVKVGSDNVVRSAVVKTQFGTLVRPAVKLAVLDVSEPANNET